MNKGNSRTSENAKKVDEKDNYFQAAFGNAFVGMAITDAKGQFIQSNSAFVEMTGYSEEELTSKNVFLLTYTADKSKQQEAWERLLKKEGDTSNLVLRYQKKSSQVIWVRNSFSLINNNSSSEVSVMVMSVDVSGEKNAQHEAEEITRRFRFLADSMPQQIWTADAEGNLNYFSRAFYEYTGLTYNDIKNSNWTNLVSPDDREGTAEVWKRSIETGEEFIIEHRLKRKDGSYTWQLSRAMAQKNNHGKIILWLGTTSNIHRQKTVADDLEKQVLARTLDLQQANFNLKHSNHDLEEFAYIATHDLQEPLRKIRTYASWINKQYYNGLAEEAQDYLKKIENASERMATLIDDLLNYSLLLRPQEAYETTDLNHILEQVLKDFETVINEKNVLIERDDLQPMKAVPLQIYQLFYNLISNSLKFSPVDKQPVIQIKYRALTEEEIVKQHLSIDCSYAEIMFKDNGIGFMQSYAKKIFSIFQRLNSRYKYPGTGIGLALCQKIVIYHRGLIYAEGEENKGASFYVLLPLS